MTPHTGSRHLRDPAPPLTIPILPSRTGRYNSSVKTEGFVPENSEISPWTQQDLGIQGPLKAGHVTGWTKRVQPEGSNYWVDASRHLLTTSDPHVGFLGRLLGIAYDVLQPLIPEAHDSLFDWELVIEIPSDATPTTGVVYYYGINHTTRQPFWVHPVSTEDLGLPPFRSPAHLRSILTPEFWTHIEYFPSHRKMPVDAENELVSILAHGLFDNATSPGSTCPYSAEDCRKFIETFKNFPVYGPDQFDGYRNASFARIWSAVASARHINSFGLEAPRLDRLQGLQEYMHGEIKPSAKMFIAELLCFFLSWRTFERMTSLWNGRVIYQRHWHVFFTDMRTEWLHMGALSAVIWSGNTALLAFGISPISVMVSIAFAGASTFVSLALYRKHSEDLLATGPDITAYIISVESVDHGLRPLSIILCLPHALTLWSALLFNGTLLSLALRGERGTGVLATLLITLVVTVPIALTLSFFSAAPSFSASGNAGLISWAAAAGQKMKNLVQRRRGDYTSLPDPEADDDRECE